MIYSFTEKVNVAFLGHLWCSVSAPQLIVTKRRSFSLTLGNSINLQTDTHLVLKVSQLII